MKLEEQTLGNPVKILLEVFDISFGCVLECLFSKHHVDPPDCIVYILSFKANVRQGTLVEDSVPYEI